MALYLGSEKISSAPGTPGESATDTQVKTAVDNWFKDNPEAATTVADGSITEAKIADNAVVPQKTSFLKPNGKLLKSTLVVENAYKKAVYADTTNHKYFNTYVVKRDATYDTGIYAVKVKAGKTYTIIPCVDLRPITFCSSYSLDEASDEIKAVWSDTEELLGILSYADKVELGSMYIKSYTDRQTKMRYTPTIDGYIVGVWHNVSGALVYEGACPWQPIEDLIDDAETVYDKTYPFYAWNRTQSEIMKNLSVVNGNDDVQRLNRRNNYYQNLICSSLRMKSFGDSITFGANVGVGNRYLDFLSAKLGISIDNNGVNGATVTTGYGMAVGDSTGVDGFIGQYLGGYPTGSPTTFQKPYNSGTDASEAYNIFTIALGTNDWIDNAPLGSYADTTSTISFYGCYKKLIARIRELYPKAAIILITPWQQYYNNIHYYEANTAGYSIKDYNLAIHEIAMMTRNCWVLDMLNNAYINEKTNSEDGVYIDNVHLGRKAHILVAHELEKILMEVIMMNGFDYFRLTTKADTFAGQS